MSPNAPTISQYQQILYMYSPTNSFPTRSSNQSIHSSIGTVNAR